MYLVVKFGGLLKGKQKFSQEFQIPIPFPSLPVGGGGFKFPKLPTLPTLPSFAAPFGASPSLPTFALPSLGFGGGGGFKFPKLPKLPSLPIPSLPYPFLPFIDQFTR